MMAEVEDASPKKASVLRQVPDRRRATRTIPRAREARAITLKIIPPRNPRRQPEKPRRTSLGRGTRCSLCWDQSHSTLRDGYR